MGLVAYSIYKQNKHDFLVAFRAGGDANPPEAEVSAYIVGEGTPRRLSTYRHLAQATIEGPGPEVSFAAGGGGDAADRPQKNGPGESTESRSGPGRLRFSRGLVFPSARYGVPGLEPQANQAAGR